MFKNSTIRVRFLCLFLFGLKVFSIHCQPVDIDWNLGNRDNSSSSALDSISSETGMNFINSDVTKRDTTLDISCVNCRALKEQCFENNEVIGQEEYYICARMCLAVCSQAAFKREMKRSEIDELEKDKEEIEQFYDWLMSSQ